MTGLDHKKVAADLILKAAAYRVARISLRAEEVATDD